MSTSRTKSQPAESSLFAATTPKPLADTLRPQRLEDVVGQDDAIGPRGPIGRMIRTQKVTSCILWAPPGVGKTTIAQALASLVDGAFVKLSAVSAGAADLDRTVTEARARQQTGKRTVLFLDECHRWSKSQQDRLLPHIESGLITFVGATTENPSFEMNRALLSRVRVIKLKALDAAAMEQLIVRAETHYGRPLPVTAEARALLRDFGGQDGRYLLTLVEEIYDEDPATPLDETGLKDIVRQRPPAYDRKGDAAYGLLSALHKTLRGSDADGALYWAARMVNAGEAPETVWREVLKCAAEEVGLADPQAVPQVIACWDAFDRMGFPEGSMFLGQAVIYVATAPKSAASYLAFGEAMRLAEETGHLDPPLNAQNAPTALMQTLGYKEGYRWDHEFPHAFAANELLPEALSGAARPQLYRPNPRGNERQVAQRMAWWDWARRHYQETGTHLDQLKPTDAGVDP